MKSDSERNRTRVPPSTWSRSISIPLSSSDRTVVRDPKRLGTQDRTVVPVGGRDSAASQGGEQLERGGTEDGEADAMIADFG